MTTFTIRARALKDYMDPLLKSAGRDDMLPVLTGIHLRGIGGTLVGVATDRFRVAFHRHRPEDMEGDDFAVLIPAKGIKSLLAVFRASRSFNPLLTVTVDATDGITVTDHAATMTVRPMEGTFPKPETILAQNATKEGTGDPFGVNAHWLGDIAAALPSRSTTTVIRPPAGPGKPIIVQPHDDLIYLVMPRRMGDDSEPSLRMEWLDLLGGAS